MMRKTEDAGWLLHTSPSRLSSRTLTRMLRVAACVLGIGLCLATAAARAGDDDDEDDTPVEDKIMRNLMSGIGGVSMDSKGIDYRERSPLVVPRTTDLPPPESGNTAKNVPNWPKDPSIAARKAAAEESQRGKQSIFETNRTLTPAELSPKGSKAARVATPQQPGTTDIWGGNGSGPMLSPSQLGSATGNFFNLFKGGKATETAQFKGEPPRESLTQPPAGYMTPSPDYAYGTGGPAKPIDQQSNNPFDPNQQQKKTN
jgi:hypothetical protein